MKVTIGPYCGRLRCTIHDRYMNKKYGFADWPAEYTRFEASLEWVESRIQDFYEFFNWLWFDRRERKVKIQIDRYDTWSMDCTLAPIILPMLIQLRESKCGAPNVDPADVPKELRPKKQDVLKYKEVGETDDKFFERWNWVMDEMIWAFTQKCCDDTDGQFYGPWISNGEKDFLASGNFEWVDHEGLEKHHERMKNGFRLFGKYYEALWD